jgi:hypothetical protein
VTYFRAVDPFPLESADHTRLHEFYTHLAAGRLTTTACGGCGRTSWPPRGFCPDCGSDRFEWVELPREGTIHAFTVQDAGLPAAFTAPRVFAIVNVGPHRIFSIVNGTDPTDVTIGQTVRLEPLRVADDPKGAPRWLVAFAPA